MTAQDVAVVIADDDLVKSLKAIDHGSVEDCFLQSPLFEKAAARIESQAKALSEQTRIIQNDHDLRRADISRIQALEARALAAESRLAEANTHITDLANELCAEIEVRYAGTLNYPSQRKKYQLDMEPVVAARDFLNAKEKT